MKTKIALIVSCLILSSLFIVRLPSARATSLGIDGSTIVGCSHSTNSCSSTLSTSNPNDILIVFASETLDLQTSCSFGVSDTAGLTWAARSPVVFGRNNRDQLQEWWAKSAGTLSSDTITESISGCAGSYGGEYNGFQAFGVSGANFNSPFDPNSALPGTGSDGVSGQSAVTSASVSTTNPNDLVFAGVQHGTGAVANPGSGFTAIISTGGYGSEDEVTSGTLSNFAVTFGFSTSSVWQMIADAVTAQSNPGDFSMQSSSRLSLGPNFASGTAYLTLYSLGGFSGTVNVSIDASQTSCQGSCSVTPTSTSVNIPASGSAQLQFTVSISGITQAGYYIWYIGFLGVSGSLRHEVQGSVEFCQPNPTFKSNNYAGYSMSLACNTSGGPIYQASAHWKVPGANEPAAFACFNQDCDIAPWVGLMHDVGGASGIVQAATITTVHCVAFFGCSTSYRVGFEFYPAPFQDCGITVSAGDEVLATVTANALYDPAYFQSHHTYTIRIDNLSYNNRWCSVIHSFADFTQSNGQPYPDMGTPYYAGFEAENPSPHLPSFSNFNIYGITMIDSNNIAIGGLTTGNNGWWQKYQIWGDPNNPQLDVDASAITQWGTSGNYGQFTLIYSSSHGRQ